MQHDIYNEIDPYAAQWLRSLIEAFEAGDMGDVEFVELALDAGIELARINEILERAKDEL